jgi:prolipoprotein diacylglyceryltransferase
MSAYLLINHLLNFMAPAALLALLLVVLSRLFFEFFRSKRQNIQSWWVQAAINFVVGMLVLVAGLVLLGRDGKMLTYVGLVLATATSQWLLLGGWKK